MPTRTIERIFPTRVDLPLDDRRILIDLLNQNLADTLDLYTQTKQAHWDVKGKDFYQLHKLFDDLAAEVFPFVDILAERVTALGGSAAGTARMAAQNSRLREYPKDAVDGVQHLEALIERWGSYANGARKAIDEADKHNDRATADVFTEICRAIDKGLYFLESHLQKPQA